MFFFLDEWNEFVSEMDIVMMLVVRFIIIRWRVKRMDVFCVSFSLIMILMLIVFIEIFVINIKVERVIWMINRECDILYFLLFFDIFLSEDIFCF